MKVTDENKSRFPRKKEDRTMEGAENGCCKSFFSFLLFFRHKEAIFNFGRNMAAGITKQDVFPTLTQDPVTETLAGPLFSLFLYLY